MHVAHQFAAYPLPAGGAVFATVEYPGRHATLFDDDFLLADVTLERMAERDRHQFSFFE